MSSLVLDIASELPVFSGLSDEVRASLFRSARVELFPPGRILFEEGAQPTHLHAILSGTIELFTALPARECGIMLLSAGDLFMPAAALFDEPYLNSARAITASRVLLLDAGAVRGEFERSHEVAVRIGRVLAGQFRMSVRHLIDLKSRSAAQRLAAFLLRLVDDGERTGRARLPIPKRNLASRVGMTAETLSRALQTLADNGLVVRGTLIHVRDRAAIDRFCGPDLYPSSTETGLDVHAL